MARVMGIDLGTTNSVVALLESEVPTVLINAEGSKTTPSVVYFTAEDERVVGELAKRQLVISPERTVSSVKRFMGCRWDESESKRQGVAYPLVHDSEGMVAVNLDDRMITPEEVSAEILRKMRSAAESHCDEEITQAVITVPAYFNDSQRQATKAAAELAGLSCLRIINEPTAAALAYGLGREGQERVAIFDLGGGTFDITLLEIDRDVIEVRATAGDNFLGGDNFDAVLCNWICGEIQEESGTDPREDQQALQRIRDAAERAKCELSTLEETSVNLPFIVADQMGPKHFARTVAREQFEKMIEPLLESVTRACRQAMRDANIIPADLDTILLVGGSTRIPRVQEMVTSLFGKPPTKSINPDEAVALGAAIQASIISGDIEEVLLLDVTPLSLGIELEGGLAKTLIPRNSSIPTTASRTFTTTRDNQRAVVIHVLQGERKIALENRSLAKFRLTGIRPAPKEVPEVEVTFHIDANGILSVSAEDLSTSTRQEVTVETVGALSKEQIERMVTDAHTHAGEDDEFSRQLEEREAAATLRDQIEHFLANHEEDLDEADRREMRESLLRLDLAIQANDIIAIEEQRNALKGFMAQYSDLFYLHSVATHADLESEGEGHADGLPEGDDDVALDLTGHDETEGAGAPAGDDESQPSP